ncbi:hypothetical protein Tco_1113126 [Tanacetum coccineum]|uniref:Uncharacterized protein n=1 Tax=Tanacetum coccineum TaxID=301880 RepID=A0ABQ5IU25_9ASTR
MFCYLTGMEPYYIQCVKDGPFQPKTSEGAIKPEFQWTNDERRVVNQDQRLKNTIISCLPDEIMESCISCETAKATWANWFTALKVSGDEEMTQVKVLMALADDELAVRKNHACNGPVTVCDTKPVTSSVPTEVKNTEQDYEIDELTKLVQMLMNEKVKSSQKTHEPTSSSKMSQDVKPKILKAKAKPFPPCTHCGCHHPGDCRNYPECAISEAMTISPQDIIVSFKGGVLAESS